MTSYIQLEHHCEQIQNDIERAVRLLSSMPDVKSVWLFGSASRNQQLDWRSDLDFAVKGLLPGQEYELWAMLDEVLVSQVDLVRIEDAGALLRQEILKGVRLYEN